MKKLFTLLTLALISIGSAWGTEVDIVSATPLQTLTATVQFSSETLLTADNSTITGAKVYFETGENVDAIAKQSSYYAYCIKNSAQGYKIVLPSALKAGDVISASILNNGSGEKNRRGIIITTANARPSDPPTTSIYPADASEKQYNTDTYTVTADDGICGASTIYIWRYTGNGTYFKDFTITRDITAPLITSQPEDADYEKDATATALSIEAIASTGELSYQWYTATSTAREGGVAISGATSSTYTPSTTTAGTFYYYCFVKDGNGGIDSEVATITVSEASAPTSVTITPSATEVEKNEEVTLSATADGTPAPTFQWYSNTSDDNTSGTEITGATEATYSPSTATIGTTYYYVVATNASGSKTSATQAIEVKASSACKLNQVIYSNTFDAFILEPTTESNGKVKAYYLAGTTEPTIASYQISENATYSIDGNEITVTAENGVTTAKYDITVEAVTPYDGAGLTFDGSEAWVKTGNAFSTSSDKKGWVISRNAKTAGEAWERESPGKNRIYLFLAPSKSFSFTNGGTKRAVKVYVNGTEKLSAETDALTDIAGDEDNAYMVAIVSDQASGDGAIKSISISKTVPVTISKYEWATFCSDYALDFTGSDVKAYIVTGEDGDAITKTEVTNPAAGTPLLLNASEGDHTITVAAEGTDYSSTNLLQRGTGAEVTKATEGSNWVLGVEGGKAMFQYINGTGATVSTDKAYLHLDSEIPAGEARSLFLDDDVTGIKNIKVGSEDNIYYDLQGRRVLYPTKGLYIVNGKKVILK